MSLPRMYPPPPLMQRLRPQVRTRGLSIVELMVGITISLFILAGASMVLTSQLDSNRRLLLEAQVQQDLRTTADMISRDVRRAGYWGKAYCQVWPAQAPAGQGGDTLNCPVHDNPYDGLTLTTSPASIVYARSTDFEGGNAFNSDDDGVDAAPLRPREQVGFRFNATDGSIEYLIGRGTWQALTDKEVIRVTEFTMALDDQTLPVPCGDTDCQARGPKCNGLLNVRSRSLTFTIVAEAVHDSKVQRSLTETVRLRNGLPKETCP